MVEIGAHARRGETPPPATLRRVHEIARAAPLAPEPFLIMGALTQIGGRQRRAEQLFAAARTRDPRSKAARYFLADRYLRTNRAGQALAEIATLSRLIPGAGVHFAAAIASFAQTPSAAPQIRRFFRASPGFEPLVLSRLAEDTRNADLILELWGRAKIGYGAPTPEWQTKLVNKLIEQGQFAKAYSSWRIIAGVKDSQTVFNPGFAKMAAPPPFNWSFVTNGAIVEPLPANRLHVLYFGRNDTVLAEQLLLLADGRYELSMDISGSIGRGGEIAWTLTCVPRAEAIFRLPVDRKGRLAGTFSVPPSCSAQRLQLSAVIGEFPQSQEFTVSNLSLTNRSGG